MSRVTPSVAGTIGSHRSEQFDGTLWSTRATEFRFEVLEPVFNFRNIVNDFTQNSAVAQATFVARQFTELMQCFDRMTVSGKVCPIGNLAARRWIGRYGDAVQAMNAVGNRLLDWLVADLLIDHQIHLHQVASVFDRDDIDLPVRNKSAGEMWASF